MKNKLKSGLQIFCFFVRIGFFTFGGGWSIIAQMEQEFIKKRQWLSQDDLLEIITVGRSLPGIMIANVSMLFGYQMAGWFGGLCALFGMAVPSVLILTLVTLAYGSLKDNRWVDAAMKGISCAVVPIMGNAILSLGKQALKTKLSLVICTAAFFVLLFTDISNIVLVLAGVTAGILWARVVKNGVS